MQRKKHKTRVAAWLLALIMMFSLVPVSGMQVQAAGNNGISTQAVNVITDVFGNNGYPYGAAMTSSSVTLVADLADGVSAGSVQWSYCEKKNGRYIDIENATSLTYQVDSTLLEAGKKYWYKCTVDGTKSMPIQLVKANSDITIKAKGNYGNSLWYVSNGYVAYTYNGTNLFNVVGYYKAKNVWIDTVYNGGWTMVTNTSVPDKFMAAFNSSNNYGINCTVILKDTDDQFSFGTDVCLGSSETTTVNNKDYSDIASLKAIYDERTDVIKQIQMVGNESVDVASDTDAAFVLQFVTKPSMYWLGHYSGRENFKYNTTAGEGVKSTKNIEGQNVVTEVGGIDSGMTCSWTGLSKGATVKFNFNVGSVADAGASIGTTSETTSNSIIYKDLMVGYVYKLQTSEDGSNWTDVEGADWIAPDDDMSITYPGSREGTVVTIKENTKYQLICKEESGTSDTETKVDGGDVTTNVDPTIPDQSDEEQERITIDTEWNKITLGNVRENYEYQLQDEYGEPIVDEWKSGDENKKIVFENLDEETTYYLVAREKEKESKSDQYPITTEVHPPLNLTYVGNFEGAEVTVPDSVEAGVPWKQKYTLSDVTPTKTPTDAYEFIGWSTKADAAEAEYQPGDKVTFEEDTTLYAIWKMPLTYTAEDVTVVYDGQPHTVKVDVTVPETGVAITYGTSKDAITSEEPAYTDAGTYQIWYQIAADNYKVERGQKTLTITKATPTLTLKNKTYLEEGQGSIDEAIVTGVNDEELSKDNIIYTYYTDKDCTVKTTSANGATSDGTAPTKKGTYYVKAVRSEDKNYKDAESNVAKIVIAPDVYFLDEDGNKHYCSFEEAFDPNINTQKETVYVAGNTIVDADVTIPEDFTLEISGGATLTISEGVTFTNEGTVFNDKDAVISGAGTFVNEGTMTNGKVDTVVINRGTLDHTTLNNTVANEGTIKAPTASKIINGENGKVVNGAGKEIIRTIRFDAKKGLDENVAESVTNPGNISIPCGNKISTLELPTLENIEDTAAFDGWYTDAECTVPATDKAIGTGINQNMTLYAKWISFSTYEAFWTDTENKRHYGSFEKVLEEINNPEYSEKVKKLHIQKEVTLDKNTEIPEGVKLVIDEEGSLKLGDGVKITVPEGIENNGTIIPANESTENPPIIEAPITNKGELKELQIKGKVTNAEGAKITNADIAGEVINDGTIKDSEVSGNVTNNGAITDTKIGGDVTNAEGATITNADITGEVTNDGMIEKTDVSGNVTNNGNMTDTNVTKDLTNNGQVTNGKVDGNVTNNESGKIQNTTIDDSKFDNNGTYTSKSEDSETDTAVTYKVTFFVDGKESTIQPQTVNRAAKVKKPERPEVGEDRVFSGWYADAECTTLWIFNKNKITKDTTLYAKTASADQFEAYWEEDGEQTYGSVKDAIASGSKEVTIQKNATLSDETVIPEGVTVTIKQGVKVTIPEDTVVTVNGTVDNNGTIVNNGTISNGGQITNNGTLNNDSGKVTGEGHFANNKTIYGGTIDNSIENTGTINGTVLNGIVTNEKKGMITDSVLTNEVINKAGGKIIGGELTKSGHVQNEGVINNTTVNGSVDNKENGKIVDDDLTEIVYQVTFDAQNHGTQTPKEQNIVCGRKVTEPTRMRDTDYVFVAWYKDQECTKEWNFTKDTVNADITLYAKWNPTSAYDTYWTNEDGERDYGTLEEAIAAKGTDIHVQRDITVSEKDAIPKDVTVTIDKGATVTITGDGTLDASSGKLINEGTIRTKDTTTTSQIIGNVENAASAVIENTEIEGTVNNRKDGQITGGRIEGTVNNAGNIKSTEVTGDVTNEGTITDSEVKADRVTNKQGGVITGGTIAGTTEKQPEIKNEADADISGTEINGNVDNAGTLGSEDTVTKVTGSLKNNGTVTKAEVSGTTTNAGTISDSKLDGTTTNSGTIEQSTVAGKLTNDADGKITAGTVTGETTNNGTISGSAVEGTVTNNGSLEGIKKAQDATIDNKNPDATMKDTDGKEITYKVTFEANGHGTAPEVQNVAYGKFATKPADPQDEKYTMRGWYTDAACTTEWDFGKDTVTSDIIIYAKWSEKAQFETVWTDKNGQPVYGTLEEALAAGGTDIHIQKELTLEKDVTIPDGTTVTVDSNITVIIPEGVTVTVSEKAAFVNDGTVKNQSEIAGEGTITNNGVLEGNAASTINTTVVNNGRIYGSEGNRLELNGSLENNGIVKDTTLNGNVKNNNTGKINDSQINAGLKNNGKVTTDGDEIIYKDQTVKGDITKGDDKENVTDATITFQQGNDKQPEQKVTDGKYNVSGLKNGYYNVVIPSEDGKVNTFLVKVEDDEIQMKAFNLPEGNLSNEVIVEEGTPNIVVGGLEDMLVPSGAASKETAGVTAADQKIAREGGDVDIKFIAKQLKTTTDEAAQIEQKMKEDNKEVGMNLDLSVLKTVTKTKGDDSTTTETKLTELDQTVMVRIPIDKDKQGKKNYVIYRSHTNADGTTIDRITEKQNSDGEYIVVEDNGTAITLYTKKFSTYVLGYDSDKKETPVTPDPEDPKQEGTTTEQPATEAPTTEKPAKDPTADFTQEQKQAVSTLMDTMKVSEAEAAEMIQFAADNGIALETMMITGQSVMAQKDDNDIAGSTFGRLQARSDKMTNTSAKIRWTKVKGADGYYIYGNKCGKKNKYKLVKEIKKAGTTSYTQKKLTKGTYYKYIVIAYKKIGTKKITIAASKTVHATTTGGKYGVAAGVKVNKKTITLNSKKKFTIKASEIRKDKKIKKHRAIAYETSNNKIATVNSKGVIKGIKKGTCYVYVYAQNGVYQKIKVKVK